MPLPSFAQFSIESMTRLLGSETCRRGAQYASSGMVSALSWDAKTSSLVGSVKGSQAQWYRTTVTLASQSQNPSHIQRGLCSCPVQLNCKHVAAVVFAAASRQKKYSSSTHETWEDDLSPLLDHSERHDSLLGIQLGLADPVGQQARQGNSNPLRLLARPVVRGHNGGWTVTGVNWQSLAHSDFAFPPEQTRWFQELHAAQTARSHTRYAYSQPTTIDIGILADTQLFGFIERAAELGITLINTAKGLGTVADTQNIEVSIDIRKNNRTNDIQLQAVLSVDGKSPKETDVYFLGDNGRGALLATGKERQLPTSQRPVRLAKATRPVPEALQRLIVDKRNLHIGAASVPKFLSEFIPVLRQQASIQSSDKSFDLPEFSGPTLVLRLAAPGDNTLSVEPRWAYAVNGEQKEQAVSATRGPNFRDQESETALLQKALALIPKFGPQDPSSGKWGNFTLSGIDAINFVSTGIPEFEKTYGMRVERSENLPTFTDASGDVELSVSTKAIRGDNDWFDLNVTVKLGNQEVPISLIITALSQGESHIFLEGGQYFSLETPGLSKLKQILDEARELGDDSATLMQINRFQASSWNELVALGVVDKQAKLWKEQVTGLLDITAVPEPDVPESLCADLRPYQKSGYSWLSFIYQYKLGGILADDMGLGKTLQTLTLIAKAKKDEKHSDPFLIVAPTSVVGNWEQEAHRFVPDLKVAAITGTATKRGDTVAEAIGHADIVITSYTLFRIEYEHYSELHWSGLILDEAQNVKNYQSKGYQCARKISAPFKLAITGTPLENNVMELWALLSITSPGLLSTPQRFTENFRIPIEKNNDATKLDALRKRIRPLMLRRTKEQVATDLPPKQEQTLEVELHPHHRKLYDAQLQRERQKVLGLLDDWGKNRFTILRSLTLLRQLSLDASLVDAEHTGVPSAKIEVLIEQLADVISGGHRALVFSQFTSFLSRVKSRLEEEGIEYSYLDGKTTRRKDVLADFKAGNNPVFLISLKAGGVGLNLTEADYCFLLDPWWNPATEAQAVDRTHRIGQKKNVMVYRLVAKDTIEDKVMAMKEAKARLFSSVLDDGGALSEAMSAQDIRELLS
ncbi:MAG: SNF2-related protein [Mycobacteriaceae bacterium]